MAQNNRMGGGGPEGNRTDHEGFSNYGNEREFRGPTRFAQAFSARLSRRPIPESALRRAEAATWGVRPVPVLPKILKWIEHRNAAGTVLGYLSVELPSGLIINDLKLMVGPKGKRWVSMPSVMQTDKEGNPIVGSNGKP